MNPEKPSIKAVLDTNVFVSSVFWLGNPHRIIELAIDRKIEVYTSTEILAELEKVLNRDFHENHKFIERQIALILEFAKIVRPFDKVNVVKADYDDNKIIECALAAKADFIVSGDSHLYDLKVIVGIKIVKPKEFLDFVAV